MGREYGSKTTNIYLDYFDNEVADVDTLKSLVFSSIIRS